MTKDSQKFLNRCYLVLDALMLVVAYVLGLFVLFGFSTGTGTLPLSVYLRALLGIIPVYLLLYAIFGLYAPKRTKGGRAELADILKANTLGFLIFTLVLYLGAKNPYVYHFSRRLTIVFYVFGIFFTAFERNCIRLTLRRLRKKGYNRRQVLLVGFSDAAKGYIDRVLTNPEWGYEIRGILDDTMEWGSSYHSVMAQQRRRDR